MNDNTFFETADLNIAAWLIVNKIAYRGSYLAKDGVSIFRFKSDDRITTLVDNYGFGSECSAKDLLNSLRFLTGQIKQNRRSGGARS
jgi:hypothetical protein